MACIELAFAWSSPGAFPAASQTLPAPLQDQGLGGSKVRDELMQKLGVAREAEEEEEAGEQAGHRHVRKRLRSSTLLQQCRSIDFACLPAA